MSAFGSSLAATTVTTHDNLAVFAKMLDTPDLIERLKTKHPILNQNLKNHSFQYHY